MAGFPATSALTTGRVGTAPQSNGSGYVPGIIPLVDIAAEFGVDVTGTAADNSTAINNAIVTAQQGGFGLLFPRQSNGTPAVVNIQNPIVIGNGTSSVASTYSGIPIVGAGHSGFSNVVTGGIDADVFGDVCIRYGGAAGLAAMVQINGPIQGVELRNLTFDGGPSANNPVRTILELAGQRTVYEDLALINTPCGIHQVGRSGSWSTSGSSSTGSVTGDTVQTMARNIFIQLCNVMTVGPQINTTGAIVTSATNNIGIIHDGQSGQANTCYGEWYGVWITSLQLSHSTVFAVVFSWSDNITYVKPSFQGFPGGAATYHGACLYYSNTYGVPQDHKLFGPDFKTGTASKAVANIGGSAQAYPTLTVYGASKANGVTPNPQLQDVLWSGATPTGVITASPVTFTTGNAWTNPAGVPVTVYLTGGVVTAVSIGGSSIGTGAAALAGPWRVAPLQTLTLTGSGTITAAVIGD